MNNLWLLLIPCGVVGKGITGVNRQVRNLICAIPFCITYYYLLSGLSASLAVTLSAIGFLVAYLGVSMGFTKYPLWLKGAVTFFPLGAYLLPLAYLIGYKTRWTNVLAEYLSGTFYGLALSMLLLIKINL